MYDYDEHLPLSPLALTLQSDWLCKKYLFLGHGMFDIPCLQYNIDTPLLVGSKIFPKL